MVCDYRTAFFMFVHVGENIRQVTRFKSSCFAACLDPKSLYINNDQTTLFLSAILIAV